MNILAINGSPRKNGNTAILLEKALEGAVSKGAQTEFINLYDFNFKGCISCFSCKLKDGKSYGKCAVKDDLTPILAKIECADALILGSPIYLGNVTAQMRAFMERAIFQYLVYDENYSSLFKRKIPIGFIYTMGVDEQMMEKIRYINDFKRIETFLERIFGSCQAIYVTDTYQFNDYSKYVAPKFNEAHKAQRRKEEFPKDCNKAFEMGAKFAGK